MIKSCLICDNISIMESKKHIGSCAFCNKIPKELKEEFAQYCDFFSSTKNETDQ